MEYQEYYRRTYAHQNDKYLISVSILSNIYRERVISSFCFPAALLVTASLTANSFWRVDRLAGKLMLPYLAWLVLANALNLNILQNNPSVSFLLPCISFSCC